MNGRKLAAHSTWAAIVIVIAVSSCDGGGGETAVPQSVPEQAVAALARERPDLFRTAEPRIEEAEPGGIAGPIFYVYGPTRSGKVFMRGTCTALIRELDEYGIDREIIYDQRARCNEPATPP